jgi:Integrase core domain
MDFLSDQLFDGRKICVLTIVDNSTRVSPAIDVRLSYRSADVVATLERVARLYGRPKRIRVDNGPEFISKELDLWAYLHGVELDFSRPGKPTDNAFAESFNGKFRTECLNAYWFLSLDDARSKCDAWRTEYNEDRPHSTIGNQTPVAWALASGQACLTRGRNSREFSLRVVQCWGQVHCRGRLYPNLDEIQGLMCERPPSAQGFSGHDGRGRARSCVWCGSHGPWPS